MSTSPAKSPCWDGLARRSIHLIALGSLFVQSAIAQSEPPPLDAGLPSDTSTARETLARLGPRFAATYSAHFTVLSDADSKRTTAVNRLAEEIWSRVNVFAGRLRLTTRPPTKKLLVICFEKWEDYERFLRPGGFVISPSVPGFFDQMNNRCVMFNSAGGPLIRDKRREVASPMSESSSGRNVDEAQREITAHEQIINETVFRHELAHQVLFNIGVQTAQMRDRRWLQEGLAMQFESAEAISPYRAADFLAINAGDCLTLFRSVIADPRPLAPGAENSARAYAAAWAIVYYLIHHEPRAFAPFLSSPAGSTDLELAVFQKSFGPIDDDFVKKCRMSIAAANSAR